MIDEKRILLFKLKEYNKKIAYLDTLNKNLIYWDTITSMPKNGINDRLEIIRFLSNERMKIFKNEDYRKMLFLIDSINNIDEDQKISSMIRKIKREVFLLELIPEELSSEYEELLNKSEKIWELAKKENDFNILKPYLKKIIDNLRKQAKIIGYEKEPYEVFINNGLEEYDLKFIDEMFSNIKIFSLDLLKEINPKDNIEEIERFKFSRDAQMKMTRNILEMIGFNFDSGRLDEGAYPTVLPFSKNDVRILTSYMENDFTSAFTSAFHTGSQGLYEQSISKDLEKFLLAEPISMIFLEAVAGLYENILGKSKKFLSGYFNEIQELFPKYTDEKSVDEFVLDLNRIKLSASRMDSDELTYNIHTIIRFEVERLLINGDIEVDDLECVWEEKYREYFGEYSKYMKDGLLQDVHWVSGYFGYYPNYILGRILSSQIYNKIQKDLGEIDFSQDGWLRIKEWMDRNIFIHGAIYGTKEMIEIVLEEPLNEKYFLDYIARKYRDIYDEKITEKRV